MKRRVVCVVTGSRAEYGILRPVLRRLAADPRGRVQLVVAGMHLARTFGLTVREIERDGFRVAARVPMHPADDTPAAMADAVGRGVRGMVRVWRRWRPDLVLVLGDRTEALAAAVAAVYMLIPLAHIHGGEVTRAGLDESARHAISKLANLHFPATRAGAARLIRMGEAPRSIRVCGAPALDSIRHGEVATRAELSATLGLDLTRPVLVLAQHSVSTAPGTAARQFRSTVQALRKLQLPTVVIYPNSDSGGRAIIREIRRTRWWPGVVIRRSVPHRQYLGLLRQAALLVGNSSSGIIEAASFRLPVVNIGERQDGRERSDNVLDVPPRTAAIAAAVRRALTDRRFRRRLRRCRNRYGDGHAAERIVRCALTIRLDPARLQKQLPY